MQRWIKRWIKLIFMVYLVVLIKLIIFKHPYEQLVKIAVSWKSQVIYEGLTRANFIPFRTIKMYIVYADRLNSFENLVGNILAFVPFGMMFPFIDTRISSFRYVLINALVLVLGIELFQLFSAFGAFDVDDIILNCFGVILGYVIYAKRQILFPALASQHESLT